MPSRPLCPPSRPAAPAPAGLAVDIVKKLDAFTLRVSFTAGQGTLALLGASGCGKSMTLQCIAGIARPDEGRITLNGRVLFDSARHIDLPPQKRKVGYLFQQYALFPNMTVEQNVLAGVRTGAPAARRAAARAVLHSFGLDGLENARPSHLSGGQQQRAALARILVGQPEALLLDEPFSALDEYLKWQLELELADTLARFGGSTVFVSHNRDEVYRLCRSVCVLERGRADPQVPLHTLFSDPATVGAARISGCKNLTPAVAAPGGMLDCPGWGVRLQTDRPLPPGVCWAGIRAHYFRTDDGPNPIPCTVDRVVENVFSTVVMLRTPGGGLLRMEQEKAVWAALGLGPGAPLTLHIRPADVMPLSE